jgi:hypothetical protein
MINISYNYISNGPGKVVTNLILGLEKSGIEFKTNNPPLIEDKLLILQETQLLYQNTNNERIIGPNICTLPIDNDYVMSQNYKKIIVPCEWVKQLYMKWLPEDKLLTWAVGINTDLFYDMSNNVKDNDCLIYFKRRDEKELSDVISFLEANNQTYEVIRYGGYSEEHFLNVLRHSKYGLIIDKCESQGIAIEEMMSTNLPLLVWDTSIWDDRGEEFRIEATSVPYWDENCGVKFINFDELNDSFIYFMNNKYKFKPREFVMNNLSLEKCAKNIMIELNK